MNKKYLTVLFFCLAVSAFFSYFLVAPSFALYFLAKELPDRVKPLKATITGTVSGSNFVKDMGFLVVELDYFKEYLKDINANVNKVAVFSFVPYFGPYISDAKILSQASIDMADTSTGLLSSIEATIPNLNFAGWGSVNDDTKALPVKLNDLSNTLSTELPKYKLRLEQISSSLAKIDSSKYPVRFKSMPVRQNIEDLKNITSLIFGSFDNLVDAVKLMPEFTGNNDTKNYLVVLQNDKQLKPSGGVLTAYAVFRVNNGSLKIIKSGDVALLDTALTNASYSPDFHLSAAKIMELWAGLPDSYPVNGVIAVDTHVISSLLDIVGNVKTADFGVVDSTNVTDKLLSFANIAGSTLSEDKKSKGAVSTLLFDLLHKTFSSDLQQRLTLAKTLIAEVRQKHVLFYFQNQQIQQIADSYDVSSGIKSTKGDYLAINDTNLGTANSNRFVTQTVKKTIEKNELKYISTVDVTYTNTGDIDTHQNLLNIYVPRGSILLNSSQDVKQFEDLGKSLFQTTFNLPPKQTVIVSVVYQLPDYVVNTEPYSLVIQKQPGVDSVEYTLGIFGNMQNFNLKEDYAETFR